MADANALIQKKIRMINNVIERGCKIILGKYIKETLIFYIYKTFYSLGYGDEGDLSDSITINVEYIGNEFVIEVYFDETKIRHISFFGSEKLGISAGSNVFTVGWINSGETYVFGSRNTRMKDVGQTPGFLEKTVESLNNNGNMMKEFNSYLKKNGIDVN